ncbi:MAG: type II toxin-antitoxin system RelE/ParE family toxin, partial [Candidatus Methylacidiphilales bacterium]
MATNPRPSGCKKLVGSQSTYRVRIGVYRVVYEIENEQLTVLIVRVRHRRDA